MIDVIVDHLGEVDVKNMVSNSQHLFRDPSLICGFPDYSVGGFAGSSIGFNFY
jgi:hypothetical protein